LSNIQISEAEKKTLSTSVSSKHARESLHVQNFCLLNNCIARHW